MYEVGHFRLRLLLSPCFHSTTVFIHILCRHKKPSLIQQLWIQIFTNVELCELHYNDFSVSNKSFIISDYHCLFPFFWIFKDSIELAWDAAIAFSGKITFCYYVVIVFVAETKVQVYQKLHATLASSAVFTVLTAVNDTCVTEFCKLYLADYIWSVHKISHHKADNQYQVIATFLHWNLLTLL